ncbi:MAG: NAD-dependent epimerase/dehydratase family protein [Hyphomonadaceae bacterium]|jgi:nucleoside-diphosphate-sugar epimerase|nr:NAD-dependent epimerase/dehydratase family protein [Hyphomonadaceae bacterium]
MRILILGGTGATGKALIRHLRGEGRPTDLIVISRTATDLPGATQVLTGHYAEIVPSAEFRSDLARFDAVVHLGDGLGTLQRGRLKTDTAEAERLIAASESVAVAAREAHVPLFLYVSSIKALCDEEDDRTLVEASEPRSTTLYGRSKLRLEQRVGAALAGSATRHVILRNPVMYGGDKGGSLDRLLSLARMPLPLPLGGLANRRSLLAVGNFASALAAVLRTRDNGSRGVFHVHDGPPLSTTEIVETLRTALGWRSGLFPVGTTMAQVARQMPLMAPAMRRLYGSLELSDAHFRESFGWAPAIGTRVALAEMAKHPKGLDRP